MSRSVSTEVSLGGESDLTSIVHQSFPHLVGSADDLGRPDLAADGADRSGQDPRVRFRNWLFDPESFAVYRGVLARLYRFRTL